MYPVLLCCSVNREWDCEIAVIVCVITVLIEDPSHHCCTVAFFPLAKYLCGVFTLIFVLSCCCMVGDGD